MTQQSNPAQPQAEYPPTRMIACRYVGSYSVYVPPRQHGRKYVNAEGDAIETKDIVTGFDKNDNPILGRTGVLHTQQTMQMPDHEILGQTLLVDPTHQQRPIWTGWGWCPLARHADYTPADLRDMRFLGPDGVIRYYEFHSGRTDFEPLDPDSEPTYYRFPAREELRANDAQYRRAQREAEAEEQAYQFLLSPEGQAQAEREAEQARIDAANTAAIAAISTPVLPASASATPTKKNSSATTGSSTPAALAEATPAEQE